MKAFLTSIATAIALFGCASVGNSDPYPGAGGVYFGSPSKADVDSGRAVFDEAKFSSFQLGVTTKQQVVAALGAPANWTTKPDGTSQLAYNFVQNEPGMFRSIKEARFTFDKNLVLSNMSLPKYGS